LRQRRDLIAYVRIGGSDLVGIETVALEAVTVGSRMTFTMCTAAKYGTTKVTTATGTVHLTAKTTGPRL
jgi:hypothetical protein